MNLYLSIAALAIIGAISALLVRQYTSILGLCISIVTCLLVILLGLQLFSPIFELLDRLENLAGITNEHTQPMLKVLGIGFLTKIVESICEDAGEQSIGKAFTLVGTVLSIWISLPLLHAVLDLLEGMLT